MDASALEELVYDPLKCSKLNMEQRRELVYEMSKWSDDATEMLSAWSRHEILQILCAELGKGRKYTGLTKSKMIELLLKIVREKKLIEKRTPSVSEEQVTAENGETTPKRQRKLDHLTSPAIDSDNVVYCQNSACRAIINRGHAFCQRCSCFICRQYDDNKDPSLWLICDSEPPFQGVSCGMSFHLECALRHENSGMKKDRQEHGVDGHFSCVSCGKTNDLLCSWRKQLVVARDTRRVDILCYRLSLARKILSGTELYQDIHGVIEEAVKKLEEEVGPLTGLPVKRARGIVNRLALGAEIQKLCAAAVKSIDLMLSGRGSDMPFDVNTLTSEIVRFEDISASSLTVVLNRDDGNKENASGHLLWHRQADDADYPSEPTGRLFASSTTFQLSGLCPATQYFVKVIALDDDWEIESKFRTIKNEDAVQDLHPKDMDLDIVGSPATNCSTLSNPSLEDDTNNSPPSDLCSNPLIEDGLKITPCKMENINALNGKRVNVKCVDFIPKWEEEPQSGSSSKKSKGVRVDDDGCTGIGIDNKDFEYFVKVMRCLECDGHIETSFRQKFLTWYSMRATPREVKVVKVFVDMFSEDPDSLAGQLIHTFTDLISNKRCSTVVPSGFCSKLWH